MRLFKLLEGLYRELKIYNEHIARTEEEKARGNNSFKTATSAYSLPPEYRWIKLQLFQKNITQTEIARKANCTNQLVSQVICGQRKSEKVKNVIANMLGYESYEQLKIAAFNDKEAV